MLKIIKKIQFSKEINRMRKISDTKYAKKIYKETKNQNVKFLLKKVYSYSNLNDGSKIELKSEKAIYNRQSQNIVYYDKVKIENKDVLITSDNAEYITKTNLLTLYGNVRVKKNKDYLISDTVIFNTKTKNLKFSMKDKTKKVYGKKTKN